MSAATVARATCRRGWSSCRRWAASPRISGSGLVDFLHLRDGREVNLCWRYGEERITHWHGLNEGYASRKPL